MTDTVKYSYINTFRWIYSHLQKFRKRQFFILFAGMSCTALLETVALGSIAFFASTVADPVNVLSSKYVNFAGQIIKADFLNSAKGLIIAAGLLMVFLVTVKNSVKALTNYGMIRFSVAVEAYFGKILLNGFLKLPYQWHLSCNSADLVNAVQWRVFLGRNFFQPSLKIFNNVLMVSIMLTSLFIVQPIVSFIVLVVLGTSAYFIYTVIRGKIDRTATIARNYQRTINKEATMAIHGVKDVKIAQKEDVFVAKFADNAVPLSRIFALQKFYDDSPVLILETIGFGMICLSICVMLLKFDATTAYVTGTMALLAVTAWKVLPAVSQILNSVTTIRKALPYISSQIEYFTRIETDKNILAQNNAKSLDSFRFTESIKFNNVNFAYQNSKTKVLKNIDFEIKKGETIGVVGTSGAGKSTLVDLLIGLHEPIDGTIVLDDQILTVENLFSWLGMIGYVPQSPYIYDGTLAENVAFGVKSSTIDSKRVKECCSMAAMDDFINDLPNSIDSFIGERGVRLSGGQQQRVAIARALYNQPEVMIFDEATSSLDSRSEKAIQKTIYSFKGRQTLIIIAHRLTTVEDCDKVIWLEKGRIKMIGSPEKVLALYQ